MNRIPTLQRSVIASLVRRGAKHGGGGGLKKSGPQTEKRRDADRDRIRSWNNFDTKQADFLSLKGPATKCSIAKTKC